MPEVALIPLDQCQLSQELDRKGLFEASWYSTEYPSAKLFGQSLLENYIQVGRYVGRSPSTEFDAEFFRDSYGDVPDLFPEIDYHLLLDDGRPTNAEDAQLIVASDAKSEGFAIPEFSKIISFCIYRNDAF